MELDIEYPEKTTLHKRLEVGTAVMISDKTGREGSFSNRIEPGVLSLLTRIGRFLAGEGIQSYLVGGLVRDVLLGRHTADIDIALSRDALEVSPRLATALGGKYVSLDRVNRVARIVLTGEEAPSSGAQLELDFSTFGGSIEEDLARRDFTIDAIAIDLSRLVENSTDFQLVDPFNGIRDIGRHIIRAVSETAFASDPARLLRAVRLAAELGFDIDDGTEELIRRDSHLIRNVAGERVREELLRLLTVPDTGQFLPYLDRLGLLTAIIPELAVTKGVQQPKEHFWDVFEHSLKTVTAVDFLLRRAGWEYAGEEALSAVPWSARLAEHFDEEVSSGSTRRLLLKVAALLHDVSKPQTMSVESDGRVRFLGHASEGATIATSALQRLRFSTRETRLVETTIKNHLRPGQMSQNELPTRRAMYRYFRDAGDTGIDILFLSLADHLATRGPNLELSNWREHVKVVEYVLAHHFEQQRVPRPARLVDGHDLINIFGLSPGPKIREFLEAVQEAQASGEVADREQALAYIRDQLLSKAE